MQLQAAVGDDPHFRECVLLKEKKKKLPAIP